MQVGGDGYLSALLECGKSIVIKANYRIETIFNVISIIFVMIDICRAYKKPCKIYEVLKSYLHEAIVPHMFHTNNIIYTKIIFKKIYLFGMKHEKVVPFHDFGKFQIIFLLM